MNVLGTLALALRAYIAWVQYTLETEADRIEDEIDNLAGIGSPAAKLRLERLGQRLKRKRERLGVIRSANGDPAAQ